jgi:hypothetical protein
MNHPIPSNHPLVGVWRVKAAGAPFPYHLFVFHADGTLHQSNPPAGNTNTSDTAGLGLWAEGHDGIRAKFEEYRVDFATGAVTRGVVTFQFQLSEGPDHAPQPSPRLTGTAEFRIYDPEDDQHIIKGPLTSTLEGQKVTL